MDNMTLEEEWMAQILAENTKSHHKRGLHLFREYLGKPSMSAEELVELKKGASDEHTG